MLTVSLPILKNSVVLPSRTILLDPQCFEVRVDFLLQCKRIPGLDTSNEFKALGHTSSRELLDSFKWIILHGCSNFDKLFKAWIPGSIYISKLDLFSGTGHAILMQPSHFFFHDLTVFERDMFQSR